MSNVYDGLELMVYIYIYNFFKFQKCHCLLELKYEVIIVHVICGIKIMLRLHALLAYK